LTSRNVESQYGEKNRPRRITELHGQEINFSSGKKKNNRRKIEEEDYFPIARSTSFETIPSNLLK